MFGWVNSFKIHSKKSDMIGREGNKGKGGGEWDKKQNAQEENIKLLGKDQLHPLMKWHPRILIYSSPLHIQGVSVVWNYKNIIFKLENLSLFFSHSLLTCYHFIRSLICCKYFPKKSFLTSWHVWMSKFIQNTSLKNHFLPTDIWMSKFIQNTSLKNHFLLPDMFEWVNSFPNTSLKSFLTPWYVWMSKFIQNTSLKNHFLLADMFGWVNSFKIHPEKLFLTVWYVWMSKFIPKYLLKKSFLTPWHVWMSKFIQNTSLKNHFLPTDMFGWVNSFKILP